MKRSKKLLILILFLLIYVFLLLLLVLVERRCVDSSIDNFSDAFWYSLATVTTVGYGDAYPVTGAGRLLGMVFMLLSIGFLGFILSIFISKFSGKIWPYLAIRFSSSEKFYIFDNVSENAVCLSESVARQDRRGLIIFCNCAGEGEKTKILSSKAIYSDLSVEEVLSAKKSLGRAFVFSMGGEGYSNYQRALSYKTYGAEIYCEAPMYVNDTPSHIHVFNKYTGVARDFWEKYPLLSKEKRTVIIGCGGYGNAIIEQGFLVNTDRLIGEREYHIFGDTDNFTALHTELKTCFGINEKVEGKDSLYFYNDSPLKYKDLLEEADRIIICGDESRENLEYYNDIYRYIPISGKIYVRDRASINLPDNNVIYFGAAEDILSYDTVVREALMKKARDMHNHYCEKHLGDLRTWYELPIFTRRSNMAVADHIPTKVRILLEDDEAKVTEERLDRAREVYAKTREECAYLYRSIEHERWMRFHVINNWKYASERDNEKRHHHLILPMEELSLEEQAKDDYSWEIL